MINVTAYVVTLAAESWQTKRAPPALRLGIPGAVKNGLYALRVNGESLEGDGINDGDLLIVEPDPDIIDGKIYIVRLGNQAVARHSYRHGSRYKLVSSNSKYKLISPDK